MQIIHPVYALLSKYPPVCPSFRCVQTESSVSRQQQQQQQQHPFDLYRVAGENKALRNQKLLVHFIVPIYAVRGIPHRIRLHVHLPRRSLQKKNIFGQQPTISEAKLLDYPWGGFLLAAVKWGIQSGIVPAAVKDGSVESFMHAQ